MTSPKRVLVVDDDPLNVKLLATILASAGYDIIRAYSGNNAIKKAMEELPDLILLDIVMPDPNGYEVTRRLKKMSVTRDIPVVLITTYTETEDKVKGLQAGADEFLNRPIDQSELQARIRSLIALKEYREQLQTRTQLERSFTSLSEKDIAGDLGKILLVEDNEIEAKIIKDYLNTRPYHVEHLKNGMAAIRRVRRGDIDIVLLDLLLPKVSGFEVCRQLKEHPLTRNIQVIMVTALDDIESKIRGLEQGTDDFLVKPIHKEILLTRIESLLKKKRYVDRLSVNYEKALQSAITDSLTGLYNQAYFKRFLELEMERTRRQKHSLTLMMLDLDDFKVYNDTLGHLTGDQILQEFSQILQQNIRKIDLAARYGGEEFAIVLTYTDVSGAIIIAERLRQAIESYRFSYKTSHPSRILTTSIGLADFHANPLTVHELIKRSDTALYQAKRAGKNRICVFDECEPD
ncbi:response regulator with diguanylate cyclase GGDEF domain, putative [Candidatus Vecturithrix granuli]|uniref:Response regulator with diguanylate cyclase GGDEF domain, putative n=1 Tax=Vecturithrix granuli TaxID=1499967 RepID=A0A081C561_VECG1|nr:response regulator with diguanylate cyclase GGDEF domain, putative [Candidatus Vecturithrix granuli]